MHDNVVRYNQEAEAKDKNRVDDLLLPVALKMESVSKVFKSPAGDLVALKEISFAVRKGEFISIVGPSGSGKSTLLNIIGALDRPSYGRVFIDNVDIFSLKDSQVAQMRNTLIGYI
ncbi:MAG: ATP-binding cassette domain-containing protein, partial [Nitrososphaeraceae archaeon]